MFQSQSEHSGSELDSAADSPLVTESIDSDQLDTDVAPPPAPTTPTTHHPHDHPSSTSSSPLLTALLHSPTRTIQSPPILPFPTSPYKTPTISAQQSAATNLSNKFSSSSATTASSLSPLISSPTMPSPGSANNKTVSPESKLKSVLSFDVNKQSTSSGEVPVSEQSMETVTEDRFDEPEAENDAVCVMDTNDDAFEQNVEIRQGESMIFKSDNEDMADTLTDIDELLRDKLKEGEMVSVDKIEDQLIEEAMKINTESEVCVDVIPEEINVIEASKEPEGTESKLVKGLENITEDIKLEENDVEEREEKDNLETFLKSESEATIKTELEANNPVEEEIDIKCQELETPTANISKEQVKVEKDLQLEDVLKSTENTSEEKNEIDTKNISPNELDINSMHQQNDIKKEDPAVETNAMVGVDGVESVPCSPPTPSLGGNVTPTPTAPTTSTSSTPTSAATIPSTPDEDKEYKMWKKSIILVWGQIAQHKNANLFAGAVSESDAPEYR